MKRTLLSLIAIVFLLVACKKDENATKLDTSRKAWQEYKVIINNSYSYKVYSGSVFGGYHETRITVQNGQVTERLFIVGIYPPNSPNLEIKSTWTETGVQIGSHKDGAADAITLDQVYAKAPSLINVDRRNNDIYFEVDSKGLISLCGYNEKGCMDDCFNGLHIKDIMPL
ncbi:MAG: hypothetical protein V4520_03120 [Bacteroidota bacterium]